MASDPVRQFIEDVHARYVVLFKESLDPKIGKLEKDEHGAPNRVAWQFGGIQHEEAAVVDSIGTEVQELILTLWAAGPNQDESESATRTLKNRILLAARQVAQRGELQNALDIGDFDWIPEAHMHKGRKLEGSVSIRLPIPAEQFETVIIQQAQVTQHADYDGDGTNDETIHATEFYPPVP